MPGGIAGAGIQAITQDPAARDALARKLAMSADLEQLLTLSQALPQGQGGGSGGLQLPQTGTPPAVGPAAPQSDALLQQFIKAISQQSPNQDVLGQLLIGGNRGRTG